MSMMVPLINNQIQVNNQRNEDIFPSADIFPSIGFSGVMQEAVEKAIDFIIKDWAQIYFDVIKSPDIREYTDSGVILINDHADIFIKSKNGPGLTSYLQSKAIPGSEKERPGKMYIYPDNIKNPDTYAEDIKSGRFFVEYSMRVNEITGENPIDKLLRTLCNTIYGLGYPQDQYNEIEVRFEKGYFKEYLNQAGQRWHFDAGFSKSLLVCWSNAENWSTKILKMDQSELKELEAMVSGRGSRRFNDDELDLGRAESVRLGYLYNALDTVHRAPRKTDLVNAETANLNLTAKELKNHTQDRLENLTLKVNDFRMLILFRK